jgi:hypothetical protein
VLKAKDAAKKAKTAATPLSATELRLREAIKLRQLLASMFQRLSSGSSNWRRTKC